MEKHVARPLIRYRLTDHARQQMARRRIQEVEVMKTLSMPEQVLPVREGRVVYQSRVEWGKPPREHLLRVFVDIDREPPEVVTVYRTSKVKKYWREEE